MGKPCDNNIEVTLDGYRDNWAALDTGAEVSMIDSDFVRQCLDVDKGRIKPCKDVLVGASGKIIPTEGTLDLQVEHKARNEIMKFVMCKDVGEDILIGREDIGRLGYGLGVMEADGNVYPLGKKQGRLGQVKVLSVKRKVEATKRLTQFVRFAALQCQGSQVRRRVGDHFMEEEGSSEVATVRL